MYGDDIEDYKRLYREGFPEDSEAVLNYFFDNIFKIENCYINATKTACLHIVYKKLNIKGAIYDLPYIVAISTAIAARGKGESIELLQYVIKDLGKKGLPFVALYPVKTSGFRRYDFVTVSSQVEITPYKVQGSECEIAVSELSADQRTTLANFMLQSYNESCVGCDMFIVRDIEYMKQKVDLIALDSAVKLTLFYSNTNKKKQLGYLVKGDRTLDEFILPMEYEKVYSNDGVQLAIANAKKAVEVVVEKLNVKLGTTLEGTILQNSTNSRVKFIIKDDGKVLFLGRYNHVIKWTKITRRKFLRKLFGPSDASIDSAEVLAIFGNAFKPINIQLQDKF